MADPFITPDALAPRLHLPNAPVVLDLRIDADASAYPTRLPGARRLSFDALADAGPFVEPVVVYCQKGGKISQLAASLLRQRGADARALFGGHLAWVAQSRPTVALDATPRWIVPLDPCWAELEALWTLLRLVDREAHTLAVARDQLSAAARVWDAARLPTSAADIARGSGLTHPVLARLQGGASPLQHLLDGRLARNPDPVAALDLVDDLLASKAAG